jgi:6-phosphogluconolactonase
MPDVDLPGQISIVDDVPRAFARLVAERAPRSIALSGGSLAEECYRALRDEAIEWASVDVYFGDERVVPVDHPDSNEGMARRVLLDDAAPKAIHSMVAAGADAYDGVVRAAMPIDIVHLGLGPDGHTASLFPGAPQLDERDRFVVDSGDDAHPHPRITFTFPAIARSQLVVVTVAGEEKRDPIARIRAGEDLPGARIRAAEVLWLGDAAALGTNV